MPYYSREFSYYNNYSGSYNSKYYEEDDEVIEFEVYAINSSEKGQIPEYDVVEFRPHEFVNYNKLIRKLHRCFPFLRNESYYLTCIDEYGNFQDIGNDEDLDIIMEDFDDERNLYILYNDEIQDTSASFPSQYYCNFCCFALEYFRYKCTLCPEYDLCSRCQNDGVHNDHELEYLDIATSLESYMKVDEIDYHDLVDKRHIGEGSFGDVYSAIDKRTDERVAVKFFKDNHEMEDKFLKELQVFEDLGEHENLVKILGYCAPRLETNTGLIMECVTITIEGKEISGLNVYLIYLRRLLKSNTPIDHRELDGFALQIARGMEYLEARNVLHRDLATRNVLIDSNKNLKISDFGLSRTGDYYQGEYSIFASRWAAPEVINFKSYSNKSDVYSFGVVLWEIATLGGLPYDWLDSSDEVKRYVGNGRHLSKPKNVSDRLFDMMVRCWARRPANRPDFADLVDKLLDFKWMASAYYAFEELDDDFELPNAWEVYERRLNWRL